MAVSLCIVSNAKQDLSYFCMAFEVQTCASAKLCMKVHAISRVLMADRTSFYHKRVVVSRFTILSL